MSSEYEVYKCGSALKHETVALLIPRETGPGMNWTLSAPLSSVRSFIWLSVCCTRMPFRDVLIGPRGRHTFLRHASLTPPFAIQENDMSRSMLHLCKEEATVLLHHFFFFLLLIFLPFGITFFTLYTKDIDYFGGQTVRFVFWGYK